jgi:hypothetical protein
MAGPWLYSIAAAAKKSFDFDGRRAAIPVNNKTYSKLVKSGRIVDDPWWNIRRNWNNVQVDDEVFIYTGDEDKGIIGYAIVDEVKQRSGEWSLRLRFDVPMCRALVRDPIPAPVVRRWIPFPRGNVLSLEDFAAELYRKLGWDDGPDSETIPERPADESDIEGMKKEVTVLQAVRSRRLRNIAYKSAHGICCVCDTDFSGVLGGKGIRVLQVHHIKQLSTRSKPSETKLSHLVVVCANCHLLLHLDVKEPMSVGRLRTLLAIEGSPMGDRHK